LHNYCWLEICKGLHAPVIHVPAFIGTDGMPIGISLVAARGLDQRLLQVSKRLSAALMAEGGWQIIGPSDDAVGIS
jgi:Asp-tRNA(Asn)/Glu-tRNA(Gln) amidotransferase A subunit family amidase